MQGRALDDVVNHQYRGTVDQADYQAAWTTFNKAFGAQLKPLADKATKPELKAALTRMSDTYSSGQSDLPDIEDVGKLCPLPSPSPS